ncbi:unnamed protein product [Gemmataceae bacterium]|nr:unnamed protein product [Gemmataceae bacterium]VTT96380.1 unnamed protein product [Gemmataceae bacterium]
MKVEKQIDDALKGRDDLIRILDAAADFLASRDTDADSEVTATWHLRSGPNGEPGITLDLRDEEYTRAQWFPPNQLVPTDMRELRLVQLWNDVLQQRTHRQMRKVNELISQLED